MGAICSDAKNLEAAMQEDENEKEQEELTAEDKEEVETYVDSLTRCALGFECHDHVQSGSYSKPL